MNDDRFLADPSPEWTFVFDKEPPLGVALHLLMEWGGCIKGHYNPHWGAIAWRPLPSLTPEQKRRKLSLKSAGYDLTKHRSKQHESARISGIGPKNGEASDL